MLNGHCKSVNSGQSCIGFLGQLLLFDPGQTTIKDKIDPRQNFERKDTRPPDVDCSGRGQERQGMGQMHESRSKAGFIISTVHHGRAWENSQYFIWCLV